MTQSREEHRPVALQRSGQFVGRTTNWLYDHLRAVPCFRPVVLCDRLENRAEFPEIMAWEVPRRGLPCRIWNRLVPNRSYPPLLRRISSLEPRLVHSHFGYIAAGDHALVTSLRVPWFVSFYGADAFELGREPTWQARYAEMFDVASRVLALGPVMAQRLIDLGCPPNKVRVHPLGIDTRAIAARPRTKGNGEPLRVLFAGTLREKKGVEYLIDGVHLARSNGVRIRLELVGDASTKPGDEETRRTVFEKISKYALEDIVHHHSWLPFDRLMDLSARCHVFAAPSVTAASGDAEGTPFVIQQMMATSMPVISTRHSDIPFIFGEHQHLLLPERDPYAIAERLLEYQNDPERLEEDGKALRERVRSGLDVQACAARLSELYLELAPSSFREPAAGLASAFSG